MQGNRRQIDKSARKLLTVILEIGFYTKEFHMVERTDGFAIGHFKALQGFGLWLAVASLQGRDELIECLLNFTQPLAHGILTGQHFGNRGTVEIG